MTRVRCAALACLLAFGSSGCLVRRRIVAHGPGNSSAPRKLITVSCPDLVQKVRNQYSSVQSFNATVDMTPALGSVYKGEITEYQDIVAYILYKSPEDIRIIGLAPVVRTKVFDMVSMGGTFDLYIPPKNRFVEGRNDAPPVSKNSLENLRPRAFLEAILVPPPADDETPLCVDSTDVETSQYVMVLVGRDPQGKLVIDRAVFIDRTTLYVSRQKKYNNNGDILSDTLYSNWGVFGGVSFPRVIDINRPEDGYGVNIKINKIAMNADLTNDKFVLTQPPGTQLQTIGAMASNPSSPTR